MSRPDDSEFFFDVLSGKKQGQPIAEALRKSLADEKRTLANVSDLSAHASGGDVSGLDDVRQKLFQIGVFKSRRVGPAPSLRPDFLQRVALSKRKMFIALVAGVACIAIGVAVNTRQEDYSTLNYRDLPPAVVELQSPDKMAGLLTQALRAAGAKVDVDQKNDNEWHLKIVVPETANKTQVDTLLRSIGIINSDESTYNIILKLP